MNQVTFIIDHPKAQHNRLTLCGKLLNMWLQQGKPAFCLVSDADYAAFLDDYLWSDKFDFLPHTQGIYNPAYCQASISSNMDDAGDCPSIFNCTNQAITTQISEPQEIIEWVSNQPDEKAQMRDLFSQYKALNIQPHTVRM